MSGTSGSSYACRLLHLRRRGFRIIIAMDTTSRRQQAHVRVRSGSMDRRETTLKLCLRWITRGSSPILNEDVYTPGTAWAADRCSLRSHRQGFTALKAYFGRYFEGAATGFSHIRGSRCGRYGRSHPRERAIGPREVLIPGILYGISSISTIHEPMSSTSRPETQPRAKWFTATGICDTNDFINNVISNARWSPVQLTNHDRAAVTAIWRTAEARTTASSSATRRASAPSDGRKRHCHRPAIA